MPDAAYKQIAWAYPSADDIVQYRQLIHRGGTAERELISQPSIQNAGM